MDEASITTPARVSLAPFTPSSTRRQSLCRRFAEPSQAVSAPRRPLAWISLQGRLVGAQEATSAKTIGGGLSREDAAAWELFSPLHRVLVVAIVAKATSESKRAQKVSQMQRSIDIRDQVLLDMQQKLEELCEQMNSTKEQPLSHVNKTSPQDHPLRTVVMTDRAEFCNCGSLIPQLNPESGIAPLSGNVSKWAKDINCLEAGKDDTFKASHMTLEEQEERRMSDLSDFSSVTSSSMDVQLSTLAIEQDFYNLRKECEEKDAAIKELSAAAASSFVNSKRVMELEEIVRRKNMVITKLKKDMVVLEQKVMQLTRLRRPSIAMEMENTKLPVMANNLLYDMSSTSSSSSDSDTPAECRDQQSQVSVKCDDPQGYSNPSTKGQSQAPAKSLVAANRSAGMPQKQWYVNPNKENVITRRADSAVASRSKKLLSSNG